MSSLDDLTVYSRFDPSHMLERIASLPEQCIQAWEEGSSFRFPVHYAKVKSIVFLGVGGSAIGGDLVAGLAHLENRLPVTVLRDHHVPTWVSPATLVIASSYSGNTEETVSMYHQAKALGACMAVVAGGGQLSGLAREDGVPLFTIPYKGEARSAIGYSFVAPLALISQLGLLPHRNGELWEAVQLLRGLVEGLSPEVPTVQNLAKGIAQSLHGKLPVVYAGGFLSGAARRWKTQLNENSKVWAFSEGLPELGHNSVEGYCLPKQIKDSASVVLLHSPHLFHRISVRYQAVEELLVEQGIPYRQIDGVGDTPLAHLLSTVMLGDYVSYYLALLNKVNPASQEMIDQLKARLAESMAPQKV